VFFVKGTCKNKDNKELFKFSKAFISKIKEQQDKGYIIEMLKINFMVYWRKENTEQEILIILSEIFLKKVKQAYSD
jgi:ATP-dependent DNA helicase RecQ